MLGFLAAILQVLPLAEQVGESITPIVTNALAVYNSGQDPTDAQWQELRDTEARLTAIIDQRAAAAGGAEQPTN